MAGGTNQGPQGGYVRFRTQVFEHATQRAHVGSRAAPGSRPGFR
jgi:hypothetical protein